MRATKLETAKRVEESLRLILLGAEFPDLREYARQNDWNLSDGQLHRYHAKAMELAVNSLERSREKNFARHLLQRRNIYSRAMEAGDWRVALMVVKDEAQLLGLYPESATARDRPVFTLNVTEQVVNVSQPAALVPEITHNGNAILPAPNGNGNGSAEDRSLASGAASVLPQ
jgi:hypothetical protein